VRKTVSYASGTWPASMSRRKLPFQALNAARDTGILEKLTIITTDLFPDPGAGDQIGRGHRHHLPAPAHAGTHGVSRASRISCEGDCPSFQLTLAPHLVMRGNLDFFLRRLSVETSTGYGPSLRNIAGD